MTRERLSEIIGPDERVGWDYGTGSYDIVPGHLKAETLRALLEEGLVEVRSAGDWSLELEFKK